jgi:hypothetical protein
MILNSTTCERFYFIFQKALERYDFEFWAWPVDFRWSDVNRFVKLEICWLK